MACGDGALCYERGSRRCDAHILRAVVASSPLLLPRWLLLLLFGLLTSLFLFLPWSSNPVQIVFVVLAAAVGAMCAGLSRSLGVAAVHCRRAGHCGRQCGAALEAGDCTASCQTSASADARHDGTTCAPGPTDGCVAFLTPPPPVTTAPFPHPAHSGPDCRRDVDVDTCPSCAYCGCRGGEEDGTWVQIVLAASELLVLGLLVLVSPQVVGVWTQPMEGGVDAAHWGRSWWRVPIVDDASGAHGRYGVHAYPAEIAFKAALLHAWFLFALQLPFAVDLGVGLVHFAALMAHYHYVGSMTLLLAVVWLAPPLLFTLFALIVSYRVRGVASMSVSDSGHPPTRLLSAHRRDVCESMSEQDSSGSHAEYLRVGCEHGDSSRACPSAIPYPPDYAQLDIQVESSTLPGPERNGVLRRVYTTTADANGAAVSLLPPTPSAYNESTAPDCDRATPALYSPLQTTLDARMPAPRPEGVSAALTDAPTHRGRRDNSMGATWSNNRGHLTHPPPLPHTGQTRRRRQPSSRPNVMLPATDRQCAVPAISGYDGGAHMLLTDELVIVDVSESMAGRLGTVPAALRHRRLQDVLAWLEVEQAEWMLARLRRLIGGRSLSRSADVARPLYRRARESAPPGARRDRRAMGSVAPEAALTAGPSGVVERAASSSTPELHMSTAAELPSIRAERLVLRGRCPYVVKRDAVSSESCSSGEDEDEMAGSAAASTPCMTRNTATPRQAALIRARPGFALSVNAWVEETVEGACWLVLRRPRLHEVCDELPLPLIVVHPGTGRVLHWSEAAELVTGRGAPDMIGWPLYAHLHPTGLLLPTETCELGGASADDAAAAPTRTPQRCHYLAGSVTSASGGEEVGCGATGTTAVRDGVDCRHTAVRARVNAALCGRLRLPTLPAASHGHRTGRVETRRDILCTLRRLAGPLTADESPTRSVTDGAMGEDVGGWMSFWSESWQAPCFGDAREDDDGGETAQESAPTPRKIVPVAAQLLLPDTVTRPTPGEAGTSAVEDPSQDDLVAAAQWLREAARDATAILLLLESPLRAGQRAACARHGPCLPISPATSFTRLGASGSPESPLSLRIRLALTRLAGDLHSCAQAYRDAMGDDTAAGRAALDRFMSDVDRAALPSAHAIPVPAGLKYRGDWAAVGQQLRRMRAFTDQVLDLDTAYEAEGQTTALQNAPHTSVSVQSPSAGTLTTSPRPPPLALNAGVERGVVAVTASANRNSSHAAPESVERALALTSAPTSARRVSSPRRTDDAASRPPPAPSLPEAGEPVHDEPDVAPATDEAAPPHGVDGAAVADRLRDTVVEGVGERPSSSPSPAHATADAQAGPHHGDSGAALALPVDAAVMGRAESGSVATTSPRAHIPPVLVSPPLDEEDAGRGTLGGRGAEASPRRTHTPPFSRSPHPQRPPTPSLAQPRRDGEGGAEADAAGWQRGDSAEPPRESGSSPVVLQVVSHSASPLPPPTTYGSSVGPTKAGSGSVAQTRTGSPSRTARAVVGGAAGPIWAMLVSQDEATIPSFALRVGLDESFRFGRSSKCDAVVGDTFVSSVQFTIVRSAARDGAATGWTSHAGTVTLCDKSVNGTYVNVKKLGRDKSCVLHDRDLITFRLSTSQFFLGFIFRLTDDDGPPLAESTSGAAGESGAESADPVGAPDRRPLSNADRARGWRRRVASSVPRLRRSASSARGLRSAADSVSVASVATPVGSRRGGTGPRTSRRTSSSGPSQGIGAARRRSHHPHHRETIEWKIGEEMLGKGGNAEVYLGINLTNGQLIAVKRVLLPAVLKGRVGTSAAADGLATASSAVDAVASDAAAKAVMQQYRSLQEEIKVLSKAVHPNIVRYYGSSQNSTYFNILLEFVPGGSLRHLLDNFGALSPGVIFSYLRQALEGLLYLHQHNIVHSDIKTANILITEKGQAKLTDFGTARLLNRPPTGGVSAVRDTRATAVIADGGHDVSLPAHSGNAVGGSTLRLGGTLRWMDPALFRGGGSHTASAAGAGDAQGRATEPSGPTKASDIWSVGCAMIEMMSGEGPWYEYEFESEEQIVNLLRYTNDPPEVPECVECPELVTIAQSCLQLEPSRRPTCEQLLRHVVTAAERLQAQTATPSISPARDSAMLLGEEAGAIGRGSGDGDVRAAPVSATSPPEVNGSHKGVVQSGAVATAAASATDGTVTGAVVARDLPALTPKEG